MSPGLALLLPHCGGLGLGLAGEHLVPTGPTWAQPEKCDVVLPSVKLTICRTIHEGPVQCDLGESRGRAP